jgi:hypothetical protein
MRFGAFVGEEVQGGETVMRLTFRQPTIIIPATVGQRLAGF